MKWNYIKTKKWKLLKILLGIILLLILSYLLLAFYLSFASCTWPLALESCGEPGPPKPIEATKFWYNSYNVNESLNTFELPYSEAILNCPVFIDIKFSEASVPIEERGKQVFVESVNLDGRELLSEPTTIKQSQAPLLLEDSLTKTEGVLTAKIRATKGYNVIIEMGQDGEAC